MGCNQSRARQIQENKDLALSSKQIDLLKQTWKKIQKEMEPTGVYMLVR